MFPPIDRNPSFRTRASFAATLASAALVAIAVAHLRGRDAVVAWIAILGVASVVFALLPVVGARFYVGWMHLGRALGLVTGPILMFVVFVVVFVPIGVGRRLLGVDRLGRTAKRDGESYWERAKDDSTPTDYFRPY